MDQAINPLIEGASVGKPNIVRRLYDWVLSWAERPGGSWALFLIAFAESSFFPIPPDVLLIALSVSKPKRAMLYAGICLAGSVLGGLLGYYIGAQVWSAVSVYFFQYVPGFHEATFEKVALMYRENADWAVFTAGLTPIPYKVFTICAGIASVNLGVFFFASVLSRGLRFFAVAGMIYFFGKPIKDFIDKYFNLLAIVFTVLLVGGFLLIKKVL